MEGVVIAVSISEHKGTKKSNVDQVHLEEEHGLSGDAHAGPGHRQVSLLALESIEKMRKKGVDVSPGDFAENITTQGIDLGGLPLGSQLQIGEEVQLILTQIGKECHNRCAIYYQVGECVMPIEGLVARVVRGGLIRPGDPVKVTLPGQGTPADPPFRERNQE
ncbi:MAG: MOSC domain-containing protein [Candidatus Tectomicrobia bacterium]|uniref:MOSC domain-containing protein n=1 Tax=Tectimicrobiota bacterium TaxID=2528274 RepID=A0A932G0R9_UNCTE|nr:MOSC domain-containing protein [Candidatus Tectomicrobia bacterium]